jgi:hypothetical protein
VQATSSQLIVENQQNALATSGSTATKDASQIKISDMGQFQREAPELAKAMIEALAQQMCRKSQRANERLIQIMKEERQRGGR